MAKPITKLSTIPVTTLQIGTLTMGPFSVPAAVTGFIATLDELGWPYTGGRVFDWICQARQSHTGDWVLAASDGVDDNPIRAKFGNHANRIIFTGDIPGAGNAQRQIQFIITVYQARTVSGDFSVS